MPDVDDITLLRQYADGNSESAFAEIVHRHINLVYSVALRYVGNSPDAQDVTQAAFVILAQKAASLRNRTALTGWLYETTRFTAMNFLTGKTRRQAREQKAYMQSTLNDSDSESVWRQLAPLLEEAMTQLSEKERALVALRFFENKSAAETATLLGIQEWAAHKRAARATEKLRRFFVKRGIASTAAMIAGAISANSMQAAPALLAKNVTSAAFAKGAAASASTLTLSQGALKIMAWSKAKTAVVAGMVILLAAGTIITLVVRHQHPAADGMIPSPTGDPQTAEQAATVILEDWGKGDWNGFANKFVIPGSTFSTIPEPLKKLTAGLQLVSVGKPVNSSVSNMWLVPCNIRLKNGTVKAFHMHLEQPLVNGHWIFNGFSE